MNFFAIKAPASGMATARETLKLVDALLWVSASRQALQIVSDQLIKTLA